MKGTNYLNGVTRTNSLAADDSGLCNDAEALLFEWAYTGDAMDFLWWVLKPARDAGTLPLFPNVGSAVAFALAVPHRPDAWKDES